MAVARRQSGVKGALPQPGSKLALSADPACNDQLLLTWLLLSVTDWKAEVCMWGAQAVRNACGGVA